MQAISEAEWAKPYFFVDKVFDYSMARHNNDANLALDEMQEETYLDAAMAVSSFSDRIPYLTKASLGTLPSGTLVRYKGLVQDMYGNELYAGAVMVPTTVPGERKMRLTKYRDILPSEYFSDSDPNRDFDGSNECYKDRASYLLVPIPGQTPWVAHDARTKESASKLVLTGGNTIGGQRSKRSLSELDDVDQNMVVEGSENIEVSGRNVAMKSGDNNNNNSDNNNSSFYDSNDKKQSNIIGDSNGSPDVSTSFDTPEMFKIFSRTCRGIYYDEGICCLAKMYNTPEGTFKLNDIIEVIGIYTSDPILSVVVGDSRGGNGGNMGFGVNGGDGGNGGYGDLAGGMEMDMGGFEDDDTASLPPPSVAPHVHVISYRRLGPCHPILNPVNPIKAPIVREGETAVITKEMKALNNEQCLNPWADTAHTIYPVPKPLNAEHNIGAKKWVVNRIKHALNGDLIAAEYVTLAILSRLYNREESESLLLGSLPLNLCGLTAGDSRIGALKGVLDEFLPLCVQISADIQSLNALDMMPKRDFSKNRLSLSPLQLSNGTVLLIDETNLSEGELNERGIRSVSALQSMCLTQQLPMSYPYYELKVPTDIPMVVMTSSLKGACLSGYDALKIVVMSNIPLPSESLESLSESSSGEGGGGGSRRELGGVEGGGMEGGGSGGGGGGERGEGIGGGKEDGVMDYSDEGENVWRQRARIWWASVRQHDVSMQESVAAMGVESFATARQEDSRLTRGDFHRWLTVSRLLALSEGSLEITAEHWQRMRELESIRLDRSTLLL